MATPITNAAQNELFKTLMSKKGEITSVLPEKMDPEEIHQSLRALLGGLDGVDKNISKCKPLIGRLMILVKENPAVYEDLGHESYEDYKAKELSTATGYSRSTLAECQQLIQKWPNLTMAQYALYRTNKLLLLGRVTNQNESGHKKFLDVAEKKTYDELKQYLIDKGLLGEGEADGGSVIITGTKAQIKRLKSFFVDERAIKYFETDSPAAMIEKAFQESSTEWPAEDDAAA